MTKKEVVLKTPKEMMEMEVKARSSYLFERYDELKEALTSSEIDGIFNSLYDDLVYENDERNCLEETKEALDSAKRRFRSINQSKIESIITKSIMDHDAFPDIKTISRASDLNEEAIVKHLNQVSKDPSSWSVAQAKMGREQLMTYLLRQSYKGDLKASKLFLEYANQLTDLSGRPINKCVTITSPSNNQFNIKI